MRTTSTLLFIYLFFVTEIASAQSIDKSSLSFASGHLISPSLQLTSSLGDVATGFSEAEDNSLYLSSGFLPSLDLETLSLDAVASVAFLVFPNPFQNTIQVSTSLEEYLLQVFDIQGRLVFETKHNQTHLYTLNKLTSGVYLLKVQSQKRELVLLQKIIKK